MRCEARAPPTTNDEKNYSIADGFDFAVRRYARERGTVQRRCESRATHEGFDRTIALHGLSERDAGCLARRPRRKPAQRNSRTDQSRQERSGNHCLFDPTLRRLRFVQPAREENHLPALVRAVCFVNRRHRRVVSVSKEPARADQGITAERGREKTGRRNFERLKVAQVVYPAPTLAQCADWTVCTTQKTC